MQALATPLVAGLVGIVAYRQWQTAHQKVMLDLFDRRVKLYEEVVQLHADYHSSTTSVGQLKPIARSLEQIARKAKFLFGDDVVESIQELSHATWTVIPYLRNAEDRDRPDWNQNLEAAKTIENKVSGWRERFTNVCLPYMRMDQKRAPTLSEWLTDRNSIRLSYADDKQR